jgi:quinol monooxygenase YgiN
VKESADPEEEQMSQFGLVVRFALKPGCAEAFDALMRESVAGIAAHEPRTLAYAVHALEAEPDVLSSPRPADEVALAAHAAPATTRYFLDRVGDYVTSTDVQRLHLVTATGIQGAAAATE